MCLTPSCQRTIYSLLKHSQIQHLGAIPEVQPSHDHIHLNPPYFSRLMSYSLHQYHGPLLSNRLPAFIGMHVTDYDSLSTNITSDYEVEILKAFDERKARKITFQIILCN